MLSLHVNNNEQSRSVNVTVNLQETGSKSEFFYTKKKCVFSDGANAASSLSSAGDGTDFCGCFITTIAQYAGMQSEYVSLSAAPTSP